jgi:homoprotocatechuate degradation regulator HpaR
LLPKNTRRSLPMSLLRGREAVMSRFRPMLARHNVSEQQWRVLRVLAEAGPLDASEVCERASILAPSLTRIIKTLVERQFITVGKFKDDGRRVQLSIAPPGTALIEELQPERQAIYDEIETRFGPERIEQLLDLLEALIASQNGLDGGDIAAGDDA